MNKPYQCPYLFVDSIDTIQLAFHTALQFFQIAKKMSKYCKSSLGLLLVLLTTGEALRLYTYPMEPSENPDFHRYPVEHPGPSVFEHTPEFATLRELPSVDGKLVDYERLLQQFCLNDTTSLGRLVWPGDATLLFATNYRDFIDYVASVGLYITSIHGFAPVGEGFIPPPEVLDYLSERLGQRWFGMSTGEQDGHYFGALVWEEVPLNDDRKLQFMNFRDYFRGFENLFGPRMATLMSGVFPHYELKSGHYTIAGAETSQHGPNAQLRYSFIRGAGKQYGVMWYGNVSIYNRWGHKVYLKPADSGTMSKFTGGASPTSSSNGERNFTCSSNTSDVGDASGPLCGTSLNLMKRLMYAQMFYSSGYVSIEREWFYTDASQELSPIGLLQHNAYIWSRTVDTFGVHIAPIALYLDFFTGWASPRLKHGYEYHVWNNLPYNAGDYLTDGIIRLVYPSYQDSSYFHDETGISSPTPYGDSLDVLLSDAASWVLQQYDTVLVASQLAGGVEVKSNLEAFVFSGGNLVITAANLASLPGGMLGMSVVNGPPCQFVGAGSKVVLNTGETLTEPYNMSVCELSSPANTSLLARLSDGTPLVVVLSLSSGGSLTVFASPFAVSHTQQSWPQSQVDTSLPSPFPLLEHAHYFLHTSLSQATLFSSTSNLTLTVSYINDHNLYVLVSNPELKEQPLKLICECAVIVNMVEIKLNEQEKEQVGYLPDGYQGTDLGNSTATTIAGADTRLFVVTLEDSTSLHFLPLSQPKPPPSGVGIHLRNIQGSIRHEVLLMPTFFQHFYLVVVDSAYLTSRDRLSLQKEGAWLKSQGLEIRVDATASINAFPGLRFTRDQFGLHNNTLAVFADLIPKMAALGAHSLTVSLHTFTNGSQQSERDFNTTLHYILKLATSMNITVNMLDARKNPFDLLPLSRALDSYGLSNMTFTLNLARLINYGDLTKFDQIVQQRSEMLYLNAPAWDTLGIGYAVNLPLTCANSTGQAQIKDTLGHICSLRRCPYSSSPAPVYPLILDAAYRSKDELLADVLYMEDILY